MPCVTPHRQQTLPRRLVGRATWALKPGHCPCVITLGSRETSVIAPTYFTSDRDHRIGIRLQLKDARELKRNASLQAERHAPRETLIR